MRLLLEISYRDVPKNEPLEALIREQAARLDRFHDHIMGCRIALERPHAHMESGNPWRVRLLLTVPPRHELAVVRESGEGKMHDDIKTVVIDAFDAAVRQLQKLKDEQSGRVKTHPRHPPYDHRGAASTQAARQSKITVSCPTSTSPYRSAPARS